MKKIKIFDELKLEKEQEKWLAIGFVTVILACLFYVMPMAIGLMLISDLVASPVMRVVLISIFGVICILIVHYTLRYGVRACVRLAIKDYEVRQKQRKRRQEEK